MNETLKPAENAIAIDDSLNQVLAASPAWWNPISRVTGLSLSLIPRQPLLSIVPSENYDDTFLINAAMYVPDSSTKPSLIQVTIVTKTLKGASFKTLQLDIHYDPPANPNAAAQTYTIWDVQALVTLSSANKNIDALFAQYVVGDPIESRGTITIVQKT